MTLASWFQRLTRYRVAATEQPGEVSLPGCLAIRRLEDRRVLSASAIVVGTDVTFTGDNGGASADSIVFSIDSHGFLQHNLAGQNGFETSLDLDNTVAGEQKLEVDQITELEVFLGDDADSVAFAGDFDFSVGSLSIEAESISTPGGSLAVQGVTTLNAGLSNDIMLTGANDFHSIEIVSARHVTLNDIDDLHWVGTSQINGDLTLTIGGALTNGAGSQLSVNGRADLEAGAINLGSALGDLVEWGSLTVHSVGNVIVEEDSAMELVGDNSAGGLTLRSTGSITDSSNVLDVTGLANFSGTSISLGGSSSSTHFGSLAFDSTGVVEVQEDSSTLIALDSRAGALQLLSTGEIRVDAEIESTGPALLDSDDDVVINARIASASELTVVAVNDVFIHDELAATLIDIGAGGAIDGSGRVASDIIDLTAVSGIGLTGPLQLSGGHITALTTGGPIALENDQAADYSQIETGAGPITINNQQAASFGSIKTVLNSIELSVTQGDLTLAGEVNAGTGSVMLLAESGCIIDGNDGATLITAGDLSLLADTCIGEITDFTSTSGNAIDVQLSGQLRMAQVTADSGEIFVNSIGDLVVATGAVDISGASTGTAILRSTGGNLDVGSSPGVFQLSAGDHLALEALSDQGQGGVLILPDTGLDVGGGDLSLRGDLDVIDPSGRELGLLVANRLQFISGATGGETTLRTSVESLSASLAAMGAALTINEADGITLSMVETSDGDITVHASLVSSGDIEVVDVLAGNARLTLDNTARSGGQIIDGDANDDPTAADLVAREVDLRSDSGIANGQTLEIAAEQFAAVTREGQINIRDVSGDLSIVSLSRGTDGVSTTAGNAGDDIRISTVGSLSVDADVISQGIGAREVLLAADGATLNNDLVVRADIRGVGADVAITLLAGNSISLDSGSTTSASGTGEVQLKAGRVFQDGGVESPGMASADIVMADTAVVSSEGGRISLSAPDNIALSVVDAGTGSITISADSDNSSVGAIMDSSAGESANLVGGTITLVAATGIGSPGGNADIDTLASALDITNTTSGNIQINESDAVTIVRLSQSGGGDAALQSVDGTITVDHSGAAPNTVEIRDSGSLLLQAIGANSDLIIQAGVASLGGDITLIGGRDVVTVSAPVSTSQGNGDISVVAGRDIRITDPSDSVAADLRVTGSGNVTLLAANQIVLGSLDPTLPESVQHTLLNDVVIQTGTGSVTSTLPVLFDLQAPQVTAEGEAIMTVTIGRPGESNLAIRIYWGDGSVETVTGLSSGTYSFNHFYSANPDPVNPAAPILINVQAAHDPRIFMAAPPLNSPVGSVINGGVSVPPPVPLQNINADLAAAIYDSGNANHAALQRFIVNSPGNEAFPGVVIFQDTSIRATTVPVPGEGLASFVFDTTPPVVQLSLPEAVKIIDTRPASMVQFSESGIAQLMMAGTDEVTLGDRHVILEVIAATGEVTQRAVLPESTLDGLQDVIGRLPDGHYRFQLKEAGEERLRLLLDFEVRHGKIADETDETDRPPSAKPPATQAPLPMDGTPPPETNENGQMGNHLRGQTESELSSDIRMPTHSARPLVWQRAIRAGQAGESPGPIPVTERPLSEVVEHDSDRLDNNRSMDDNRATIDTEVPSQREQIALGTLVATLGVGMVVKEWSAATERVPPRFGRLSRFVRRFSKSGNSQDGNGTRDVTTDPVCPQGDDEPKQTALPWGDLSC